MAEEFTPITTQEAFNNAVGKIRDEARDRAMKKYEGWTSPEDFQKAVDASSKQIDELTKQLEESTKKYADMNKTVAELTAKNHSYEIGKIKRDVAHDVGLDWGLADRLSGETEEDIRKDAEAFAQLVGKSKGAIPLAGNTDPVVTGQTNTIAAMKTMLQNLKGDN